jgi:hypothetical protein
VGVARRTTVGSRQQRLQHRRNDASAYIPRIDELDPTHDAIIRKALARDADERFATAADLANELVPYGARLPPSDLGPLVREIRAQQVRLPTDLNIISEVQAQVNLMTSINDFQ